QLRSMARGMPIVGRFVESTPESEGFEKAFPGTAKFNAMGGTGLALAPTMAFGLPGTLATGAAVGGLDTALGGGTPRDIAEHAAMGAAPSGLGYGAGKLVGKAITPYLADPNHAALVSTLKKRGVAGLTAGQELGNEALLAREASMAEQPWVNQQG